MTLDLLACNASEDAKGIIHGLTSWLLVTEGAYNLACAMAREQTSRERWRLTLQGLAYLAAAVFEAAQARGHFRGSGRL